MAHNNSPIALTRRRALAAVSLVGAAALTLSACGAPSAPQASSATSVSPKRPSSPIELTILDGGGDLAGGGQSAIDAFVKANPDLVSKVTYQTAAATDVAGKLLAQSQGGSADTSLVLGGPDVLGAAQAQHLLIKQTTAYASFLPDFGDIQDSGRSNMQKISNGTGVLVNYDQNGPFLDYNTDAVSQDAAPTTPAALLAWAKAHPGKFSYAQPANSGSGRAFIQALPYMLGDSDPTDPKAGWTKTWAYLKQLGSYVKSYPDSSTLLAQQFGAGQLDLIPTIVSHDISFRKSSTYPKHTGASLFVDQQWITDGHFAMIPRGVDAKTLYVDLKLESYLVSAKGQTPRLLTGVLTTANKDVMTENSGSDVAAFVKQWGRDGFFTKGFETGRLRTPLGPTAMQTAFTLWQEKIGSHAG